MKHRSRIETTIYCPQRAVDCDVNLLHVWVSAPDRGTVFSCREYQGLRGDPQCFGRGSPGCTSKTTDECDSGCNLSCHFFKMLLEVQHPVQAHAKVLWSVLKQQAFVIDKHVQFPFSFSVIVMIGGRNCIAYAKLKTPFPKVVYHFLLRPSSISFQDGRPTDNQNKLQYTMSALTLLPCPVKSRPTSGDSHDHLPPGVSISC